MSVLTRVLAADALLVADAGDPCPAVTAAFGLVEVDREPVHAGSHAVVVIELYKQ